MKEGENAMFDVAIIGLGPAGATLARLIRPDFKVVAIDRKNDGDATFRKPCGGLLAPDAQAALSRFNLSLPKDVLVDPQIFAVRTIDTKQDLERYYQRFYMNLDRHKFDKWLKSLIPSNVEVLNGETVLDLRKNGDVFEIDCSGRRITAKCVVGADGAHSIVRKECFPNAKMSKHMAIQQWFEERHPQPFYSCIFDSDITDSYCWGVPKDGYFILGGAFPQDDSRQRFELLKEKLKARGFSFGKPVRTEACLVAMPRRGRDFCVGGAGVFLIGEAAGFISPSSLEGISFAISSGAKLAESLNSGTHKPSINYMCSTSSMRMKLLLKRMKRPFMYNPSLRKIVMKMGIKAVRITGAFKWEQINESS